jgi:hypothetical protein
MVTDYELTHYEPAAGLKEKCLQKLYGTCGICRARCVAKAYEGNVFNRARCYEKCLENAEYHKETGYADVCGKCLTGLPCSTGEPRRLP